MNIIIPIILICFSFGACDIEPAAHENARKWPVNFIVRELFHAQKYIISKFNEAISNFSAQMKPYVPHIPVVLLVLVLLCPCCAWAQMGGGYSWENFVEDYLQQVAWEEEEADNSVLRTSLLEELEEMHHSPIDINTASRHDLLPLHFLSDQQIDSLLARRDRYIGRGGFRSLGDLMLVSELSYRDRLWLSLFLEFSPMEAEAHKPPVNALGMVFFGFWYKNLFYIQKNINFAGAMNKTEMLQQIIANYTDGNKAKFAAMLGITPQAVNSWEKRNTFDVELLFSKCKNISARWLLSGEGSMFEKHAEKPTENYDIVDRLLKIIEHKDATIQEQAEEIGQLRGCASRQYA